jgi:hypothetical protein
MRDGKRPKGMSVDDELDGTADGTPRETEPTGTPEEMEPDGS